MNAVYPGSFNPFTYGHDSVIQEIYPLFNRSDDTIFIVPSINSEKNKHSMKFMDDMCSAISYYYRKLHMEHIKVISNYGDSLIVDICKNVNAKYIIRGIRDTSDFLHESELALYNKMLDPDISTLYVRGNNNVSSSFVREIMKYGKDIHEFVPDPIAEFINDNRGDYQWDL